MIKERSSDKVYNQNIIEVSWKWLKFHSQPVVYQSKNIKNHVEVAIHSLSKNLTLNVFTIKIYQSKIFKK